MFWVNLFKTQNKLISHSTIWIGLTWPARSLLQEADSWSNFLFINWDHNPWYHQHQHMDRAYAMTQNSRPILPLTLMASGFFNKNPHLHKMTTKPKVRHLTFGLWSKLINLFGETLEVMVWRAKRYVLQSSSGLKLIKETCYLACLLQLLEL